MEKDAENEQTAQLTRIKNKYVNDDIKSIWKSRITLEPMWLGAITSMTMSTNAFQNLFIERACSVDLGYPKDVCFSSNESIKNQIELESQQIVTSLTSVSNFISSSISCFVLLFLGPWSDSSGRRKPIILLPIIGMIITSINMLILQGFPNASTVWAIYGEVIPLTLCGSNPMLMMAATSYLGDICFKTGRCVTTMMGSNSAAISASIVIGSLLTPLLLRNLGFIGLFATSAILETFSLLYAIWKIEDVNINKKSTNIFDLTLPIQAVKCLFKKRDGYKRRNVLFMVFVPSTTSITLATEVILLYLYLRYQFQWTEVEYGIFAAYRGITSFFGAILIVRFLKIKLKMEDRTIGIVGAISQFISTLLLILSYESWMIYLAPILGIFSRAVLIAEKPVLNQQIIASEQGKLNTITTLLDKFVASLVIPMVYVLYSHTLSWKPSFFLFLGLVAAVIQFFSYYLITVEPKMKNEDIEID